MEPSDYRKESGGAVSNTRIKSRTLHSSALASRRIIVSVGAFSPRSNSLM
jgi:hypothetical protein